MSCVDRVQDGEMYASGLGRLHRIDQLREYQSDVLRVCVIFFLHSCMNPPMKPPVSSMPAKQR